VKWPTLYFFFMGSQFTKANRDERGKPCHAPQAGEAAVTSRAAWPTGPLLARAIVSHHPGPAAIHEPSVEAKPQPAPDAA